MENRKPNTECANCKKAVYKRPFELENYSNVFCSRRCRADFDYGTTKINCPICKNEFKKRKGSQKYCSKQCSGKATRNKNKEKRVLKNPSERLLQILKKEFGFTSCMVKGCSYNKTYDVHRLIPGVNGGKYEIGNMFAICPNHHAEVHRKIIRLEKINSGSLKVIKIGE